MPIQHLAMITVHTSPLAPMGGKKTGGMNVYIRELAQELGRRGLHVDIFTRRSFADEPPVDHSLGPNVRVIYLTAGPVQMLPPEEQFQYLSEFTARLIAFSTRHSIHYDLVYSHYWLSGWVAAKLKEAWGMPFVQMFHTLGQMKQRIITHDHLPLPDRRITTETELMGIADALIAATHAEHTQLVWLYRANRHKIEIVPPGMNPERFHPLPRQIIREQMRLPLDKRLLLFVGRIEPLKGVDTILHAMTLLREQQPEALDNLCFMIIGGDPNDTRDPEMKKLRELTGQLGLEEQVCFLGAKEQAQLPAYYAAADAVLVPSDYESFGMVALEAMACGTPVIASEVGGLAYLIKDGETGYLVPVRDASAFAAEHAKHYAWSSIAERLLTLFADVLNERRPGLNRRQSR
jgi:D-inositol-3-phosphate glycosyltransferase